MVSELALLEGFLSGDGFSGMAQGKIKKDDVEGQDWVIKEDEK